jgi:cellulose synthase/poly-beta-1,6-N-acetylglucosamine synthase-like glycosyltransferase
MIHIDTIGPAQRNMTNSALQQAPDRMAALIDRLRWLRYWAAPAAILIGIVNFLVRWQVTGYAMTSARFRLALIYMMLGAAIAVFLIFRSASESRWRFWAI